MNFSVLCAIGLRDSYVMYTTASVMTDHLKQSAAIAHVVQEMAVERGLTCMHLTAIRCLLRSNLNIVK